MSDDIVFNNYNRPRELTKDRGVSPESGEVYSETAILYRPEKQGVYW